MGIPVVILTDDPVAHAAAYAGIAHAPLAVEQTEVHDAGAVAARVLALEPRYGQARGLLSNSDHLQTQTAMAAELLGLPGKDWHATLRCKNKFLTRRALSYIGLDHVASVELGPGEDLSAITAELVFPAVVKPREGVASEDVLLVRNLDELQAQVERIRERRGDAALIIEEYLSGELHTYETLGDGHTLQHFGSWRTTLGDPPYFTETGRDWVPALPEEVEQGLLAQIKALGVGLGACHTEFVVDGGRARIIEVNYRLIGDTMDLICSELLGVDIFAAVIRLHLGEPLPDGLPRPAELGRQARIHYVTADREGTLYESPAELSADLPGGVRLGHRRLRDPGVSAPLHGTNRDYLSVVHALGPSVESVRTAVEDFVGSSRWSVGA